LRLSLKENEKCIISLKNEQWASVLSGLTIQEAQKRTMGIHE
jgi:hypothetical protein